MSVDHSLQVIQMAIKDGLDPSNLSPAQYRRLSIKIRSLGELRKDLQRLAASRIRTGLGDVVPEEQSTKNAEVCRSNVCGKHRVLIQVRIEPDGTRTKGSKSEACDACNCRGKNLDSKRKDPTEACPLGYWSNA